tara:strand:- start:141 stop:431 length:291 start_codon:yes stop_codon:yes gene_type:complete
MCVAALQLFQVPNHEINHCFQLTVAAIKTEATRRHRSAYAIEGADVKTLNSITQSRLPIGLHAGPRCTTDAFTVTRDTGFAEYARGVLERIVIVGP